MSTHCQIFCFPCLCLGRVQVQLSWFENKNMNVNLCKRTWGICTRIIHKHSPTLINTHTHTFKNLYISTSKHTMIHKPQLLCSILPSVCTYHNQSSLTFTPHLIQKYTGIHIFIAVTTLICIHKTNTPNGTALRPDLHSISISCTFILTSHFAVVSFLSQRKSRVGGCWVNFGTGRYSSSRASGGRGGSGWGTRAKCPHSSSSAICGRCGATAGQQRHGRGHRRCGHLGRQQWLALGWWLGQLGDGLCLW